MAEVLRANPNATGRRPRRHASFNKVQRPAASRTMYIYLNSGGVVVVPNTSRLELTDETVAVIRNRTKIAEYPRSDIYFASRELECPPGPC